MTWLLWCFGAALLLALLCYLLMASSMVGPGGEESGLNWETLRGGWWILLGLIAGWTAGLAVLYWLWQGVRALLGVLGAGT